MSNECEATIKALDNIPKYWEPIRVPKYGDWLDDRNHSCVVYDDFKAKRLTVTKNTLYI